jgi:hypothetical protein
VGRRDRGGIDEPGKSGGRSGDRGRERGREHRDEREQERRQELDRRKEGGSEKPRTNRPGNEELDAPGDPGIDDW